MTMPADDPHLAPAALNAQAQAWLRNVALPLWMGAGYDPATGGFVELLTAHGAPIVDGPRRMRVQARQIYVYADAALRYGDDRARECARRAFDWATHAYWAADGGWVFSVEPDGAPVDDRREAYEQAFAIFAAAWLLRAAPDCGAELWIARTWDFLDQRLAAPNGGYLDSLPPKLPRRQNPHMHLLEACLACHETFGDPAYLDRARGLYDLFRRHWFDAGGGYLGEYFADDWSPIPEQRFEPGHHMEWTWLLTRLSERAGIDTPEAAALHRTAEAHGRADDGLLIDECAPDGAASQETKRCWPQTEDIKGQLAMFERTGDEAYRDAAAGAVRRLFRDYLRPDGTYGDRIGADGQPIAGDTPASSLYHIVLALNEFDRVCGEPPGDG